MGFDKLLRDLQSPEKSEGQGLKVKQLFGMIPKIIDLIDTEDSTVKDVFTRIIPQELSFLDDMNDVLRFIQISAEAKLYY